jgi:hypothetical protein
MKIKIINNVCVNGKILKKDAVHDLPTRQAQALVEGEHAAEHIESAPQQQQQSPVPAPEELQAQCGAMTKAELGQMLAAAKKVKAGEADYAKAQAVIAFVKDLLE